MNYKEAYEKLKSDHNQLQNQFEIVRDIQNFKKGKLGHSFFKAMVKKIFETFNADYTFIGKLEGNDYISTISAYSKTGYIKNFKYKLEGSPCEKVLQTDYISYPELVYQKFPKNQLFSESNISGYLGVSLFDSSMKPNGIMVCLFNNAFPNPKDFAPLTLSFAAHAGSEIEHQETYKKLASTRVKLENQNSKFKQLNSNLKLQNKTLIEQEKKLKKAYTLLENNEQILSEAQKQAKIGHYNFDITNNSWSSSSEIDKIFGIDKTSTRTFETWASIIHPKDRDRMIKYFQENVFKQKEKFDNQYRIINQQDHSLKWVYGTGQLIFDEDGAPKKMFGTIQDITERKITKEALQAGELKMQSIFRVAPSGIGVVSNRLLIEVNPTICKMLGYKKEELINQSARILYPNQKEFEYVGKEKYKQIKKTGTGNIETTWKKKNGEIIHVLLSSTPINLDNYSEGVTFTAQDITKLKHLENELKLHKERFELAMLATNDGLFDYNLETQVVYFSSGWKKMLGYEEDELDNSLDTLRKLTTNEYAKEAINRMLLHLDGKIERFEMELKMRHKNGHWVDILSRANAIVNIKGIPIRIVGTTVDITPRKKIEEELRKSESNLSSVLTHSNDVIFSIDKNYNLLTINQKGVEKFKIIYGKTLKVGYNILDYVDEELKQKLYLIKKKTFGGESFIYENKIDFAGYEFYSEISVNPIKNDREIAGAVLISRDITERVQKEKIKNSYLNVVNLYAEINSSGILLALLEQIEHLTNSKIGFYHFIDLNGKRISSQNWSKKSLTDDPELEKATKLIHLDKKGVWADCVNQTKPFIYNNETHAHKEGGIPNNNLDITRQIVVPIYREDRVVAILGAGNKEKDYTKYDIKALQEIADLTWDIIIRKITEEELEQEKIRATNIIEGTNAGTWDWDIASGEIVVNERWAEIIGYKNSELEPVTFDFLTKNIHPEDFKYTQSILESHFDRKLEYYDTEFRQLHKNGTYVWINARGKVVEWSNENYPLRMSGTHIDITGRKNVDKALIKSEKDLKESLVKYKTLADYTYDWEYWCSPDNKYIYISPSCLRITGYGPSEFNTNPNLLNEIILEGDYRVLHNHEQNKLKHIGCKNPIEFRIKKKDGRVRWINHVCQPVFDPDGNYIGNRGTNRDITVQKLSQIALTQSEMRFKQLADMTFEGIVIHYNGRCVNTNTTFLNMTGYKHDELIGIDFIDKLIPRRYLEMVYANMELPSTKPYELEIVCKDKHKIPVEVLAKEISADGMRVASFRDITEQKQIRQKILNAIINTEEQERKRVAQELHDGLGPLLSTIKLYSQTYFNSTNQAFKSKIQDQLLESVNDALDQVSTISNNLSPHVLNNFGLNVAIQKFIDKLQRVSNIDIDYKFMANKKINKDIEITLYRVVIELINNTNKHAGAKNIHISIEDKNKNILLTYKDDGIGFDFEKSKQANHGMGLFNIINRITSFGGSVNFDNNLEKGVCYIVNLPDKIKNL